jgi:ElaB/YqjD/DUF883 family membrane-anchored ribosome-binding protein
MTIVNPAKESLEIEQRAQREAARNRHPDAELSDALKGTFPASDPVAVQAPVTAGSAPAESDAQADESRHSPLQTDFEAMSQNAEATKGSGSVVEDVKNGVSDKLKSYGVDANQITEAAGERVTELQRLFIDEIKARPLRALGWAAAAGFVFGFWAAK